MGSHIGLWNPEDLQHHTFFRSLLPNSLRTLAQSKIVPRSATVTTIQAYPGMRRSSRLHERNNPNEDKNTNLMIGANSRLPKLD